MVLSYFRSSDTLSCYILIKIFTLSNTIYFFQIRVNAVNPTVVLTAMGKVGWSKPERRDPMIAKIPLGRFCEVDDVVGPILYYLSPLSNMVNGTMHPIDGGFLAC